MPPKPRARTYAAAIGGCESSGAGSDSCSSIVDDDYRQKRDRNNVAVKKSREKSRQRARETAERMERLRRENEELEQRSVELSAELRTLKDLLLARAARRGSTRNDTRPPTSPSEEEPSSVVLADPHTGCIDHEYTTANS